MAAKNRSLGKNGEIKQDVDYGVSQKNLTVKSNLKGPNAWPLCAERGGSGGEGKGHVSGRPKFAMEMY